MFQGQILDGYAGFLLLKDGEIIWVSVNLTFFMFSRLS